MVLLPFRLFETKYSKLVFFFEAKFFFPLFLIACYFWHTYTILYCSSDVARGKRSVGPPPTRWWDDLVKAAGSRWIQADPNLGNWRSTGPSYVQQCKSYGWWWCYFTCKPVVWQINCFHAEISFLEYSKIKKLFFLSSCNVILHVWTEITIYAKGKSAEKAICCEIENLNAYKLRLRRCLHNARVVSTKFRCTNNEKRYLFLCKIFFSPMFFLVT